MKGKSGKSRISKGYTTNIISLIVKFLLIISILEGYFLFSYFWSKSFLTISINLIDETGTITLR